MHVVIGRGALGAATAQSLHERGERVRVVSRSGAPAAGVASDIESVPADAGDASSLAAAIDGAACVYQCAQPPYHRWIEEFAGLQASVLGAVARAGADLVLADNLYGYGRPDGVIAEDSPREPTTRKGVLRRDMADAALAAHAAGRIRVALVRPANFFGPGYARSGTDIFGPALTGRAMSVLGAVDQPHSFTFVPDAGRALAAVGASETAWGRAWIAPVQPAITQRAFAEAVWRAAGRTGEPRLRVLGRRAAAVVGIFSPLVRELPEMMYEFDEPFVVDASRIARELGVTATPFDDAVSASLEWFRAAQPSSLD